ncbi:MAG TPA: hypothetical protein VFQ41_21180 [Candidatus Angelobacter sp.]|nr:hypothetical protein [Candidatus Angelobacter sp.]
MFIRLVTGSFFLLVVIWLAPGLRAQVFQAQATRSPAHQIVNQPAIDQQPRPEPQPSADEQKRSVSPKATDQSSTVGNPDAPVPLKVKGKLRYFAIESFRPGIYPVAAFYDGLTMANPPKAYPREWRQGLAGFARNYGDFMASWAAVQGGKFVVASIVHEDPRYYPSRSKNFFARSLNAVRYMVVDRGDNGHSRLALANLAGAFAGGFVGNGYLPDPYANASHGLSRSALALTGFVTSNLADEFHPEVRKVARKLHLPFLVGR